MRLTLGNVDTDVSDVTGPQRVDLAKFLTWRGKPTRGPFGVYTTPSGCLLDRKTDSFPTGMVPGVVRWAKDAGMSLTVEDPRIDPTPAHRPIPADWLRDYQHEAVRKCLDSSRLLRGRGIVHAPTGSGKSHCFSAVGYSVPGTWLVLVDTRDLLEQAASRYEELTGEEAGRVGDGSFQVERYTVATVQTLVERLKSPDVHRLLAETQGVIVDEVHVAASESYRRVLNATDAYWRLGFSATPYHREDGLDILTVAAVGPVIHKIDREGLVERGLMADATITFHKAPKLPKAILDHVKQLKQKMGAEATWPEAYRLGVVEADERNALVTRLAIASPKPALVFVKIVEHGTALLKMLRKAGVFADYVHGGHSSLQRRNAITRLERGDIDVLVCSAIFNKGIDIPSVRSLGNAAAGKGFQQALQKLGRGTRASEGKDKVEFWDIYDTAEFLVKHSKRRVEVYEADGYTVQVSQ